MQSEIVKTDVPEQAIDTDGSVDAWYFRLSLSTQFEIVPVFAELDDTTEMVPEDEEPF